VGTPTSGAAPRAASPAPAGTTAGAAIARSAFHLVLGQVATTALAVVFSAALGRRLGAADFGLYFLVTTMGTFAYVVVEWGQGQYVVRELARHPEKTGALLGASLALRIAGAVPVTLLAVAAGWALGYDGRTLALLALLMATTLPFFLSQAYALAFRARERMDLDAFVSVFFKAAALAFALAALALGGGVAGVLLAQGAAGLAALAVAAFRGRRIGLPPLRAPADARRELLREGTPILAIGLAVAVQPTWTRSSCRGSSPRRRWAGTGPPATSWGRSSPPRRSSARPPTRASPAWPTTTRCCGPSCGRRSARSSASARSARSGPSSSRTSPSRSSTGAAASRRRARS
jgi:hypothetical protein